MSSPDALSDVDVKSAPSKPSTATSTSTFTATTSPSAPLVQPYTPFIDSPTATQLTKHLPHPAATAPIQPTAHTAQRSSLNTGETDNQLLNRWAFALADWVIPRWDRPIRELDGWRNACGMHGGFVRDCSLSVFVLLGAAEEMPFTVYRDLDMGNEETIEPAVSWMRDLRARRLLHEALATAQPPAAVSPPPVA